MNLIAKSRATPGLFGNAPRNVGIVASGPIHTPRVFGGKGAPNQNTLPAGNQKFNAGQTAFIVDADLVDGGSNYKPQDVLTGQAGFAGNTPMQIQVDAVDANGKITDSHVIAVGQYLAGIPGSPAQFNGGSGNGAAFNLNAPAPDWYFDYSIGASPVAYICTQAGSNATSTWAQIGGGGGGSDMFMILGRVGGSSGAGGAPANADYLVCAQIQGYTNGNPPIPNLLNAGGTLTIVNVAKQVHMRKSIGKELYYGATITYSAVNNGDVDNTKVATDQNNNVEAMFAYPPYMTQNDVKSLFGATPANAQCIIPAELTTHGTGVFAGGAGNSPLVMWQETQTRDWVTI